MKSSQPQYVPSKSGLMEFEAVSVDSARASLDELPEGMAALLGSDYWEKVRRAPLATDRALTGHTMHWVARLPTPVRPLTTCDRYARIVNALASAWDDPQARDHCLGHLLDDRRRGRRGFPPQVERELRALEEYASGLPR